MRVWFHRFCSLQEFLAPAAALPARKNFWLLMGRRVRLLSLSDSPAMAILSRGADSRFALKVYRISDPQSAMEASLKPNSKFFFGRGWPTWHMAI